MSVEGVTGMRRQWDTDDLIANTTGVTRLGFVLLLKFIELDAHFPRHAGEVPRAAVSYRAAQVRVDPGLFAAYAWTGRISRARGTRDTAGSRRDRSEG